MIFCAKKIILPVLLCACIHARSQTYTETQSSQYSSCAGSYANLTDGNLTTIAGCNGGPGEWIKADFGSAQTVTAISVAGSSGNTCGWGPIASYLNSGSVVIQSSTNNSTWTTQTTISGVTDAGTTTFSFASVTAQYWRIYAPTGWLATSEFTFTFGSSAMAYSSGTTTQNNTSSVTKATTNNEVIGIQIVTTGTTSPLSATSFSLNTTGTTTPLADITNAKLWYTGTSSTFSATTQFGSTVAAPNGVFTISGTQTLSSGTNYFWLTYDVPAGATTGNAIDAQCTSLTVGSAQTPTLTAPAGSRTIDGPMTYISSATAQNNISSAPIGFSNQEIISIQIVTAGTLSPLSATSFSLNTTGTTNPSTDIQNAKLWYTGTSSSFATTTQFGTTAAAPNGAFTITGTQILSSGTNYFWLTYDITSGAAINNIVDAQCTSLTVGSARTPSTTNPAGNRTISKSSVGLIAAGGNHSLAVCNNGTVSAWGLNLQGQLGDGTTTDRKTPVPVLTGASGCATNLCSITAVAGGYQFSLALKNNGTVWAWGDNTYSQLGDGTTTQRNTPVQVNLTALGARTVTAIAAGSWHSLALCSDGTVWAWGSNNNGQLGDNSTTDRSAAVQVSGLTGIIAIAGGRQHSLALKNDNTVWAWGSNLRGEIGDNSPGTNRWTPVQVLTGTSGCATNLCSITAIAAADWFSLAVKSDGTAWAWGDNSAGGIGDGTTTQRNTPVQVSGLANAATVAGGNGYSLALKTDGTVWAWGYNLSGHIGDNTTTDRYTPVQTHGPGNVGLLAGITAIAGSRSQFHSISLKNDGTFWGWGYDIAGQLGDNTTTPKYTPVQPIGLCSVGPLPVELIFFSAHCTENKNIKLEWATASEMNNDFFSIERSEDGKIWNVIGTVKGAGNSSVTLNYEFVDESQILDINTKIYYRLKQTDYDGKFEYKQPMISAAKHCIDSQNQLIIFPNPVDDELSFQFLSNEQNEITVEVYDVCGRLVVIKPSAVLKGNNLFSFNIQDISKGVYMLSVKTKSSATHQKFIKQ